MTSESGGTLTLCPTQRDYVETLAEIGVGGPTYLPALLLVGPSGAGKRTVARAVAEKLGMEFVEVPLNAPPRSVVDRLCGTREEAELAADDLTPPGELGRASATVLYFSGLQFADPDLFQIFHRVLGTRRYVDATGRQWLISDDLWFVCGLTFPAELASTVGPEHWLCATFRRRMTINPPCSEHDLFSISESVAADYPSSPRLDRAIGEALARTPRSNDNLHAVRRWIEWMVTHRSGDHIGVESLQTAVLEDLRWLLPRIQYRGRDLRLEQFQQWSDQFPLELRPAAVHIVREIAQRYHIGSRRYFDALDDLIQRSGIPRKDQVAFCKWQHLGRSAPRVAHDLKNQGRWRPVIEIDLDQRDVDWPGRGSPGTCRWIVVADDFVGSGKTLSRLFRPPKSTLDNLLGAYPHAEIRVLIVAGFDCGLRQVQSALRPYRDRVQLIVSVLFSDEDRCFTPSSRIFPNPAQSSRLREFCIDAADRHYRSLPAAMRLGHGEIGALAVFFDTVPNNSLPILWHDEGTWLPLFPASGLPAE